MRSSRTTCKTNGEELASMLFNLWGAVYRDHFLVMPAPLALSDFVQHTIHTILNHRGLLITILVCS